MMFTIYYASSILYLNKLKIHGLNILYAVTDESTIHRFFARFDERFFQFSDKELSKINTFFYGRLVLTSLNRNKVIDYKNIFFCTAWYLIRIIQGFFTSTICF